MMVTFFILFETKFKLNLQLNKRLYFTLLSNLRFSIFYRGFLPVIIYLVGLIFDGHLFRDFYFTGLLFCDSSSSNSGAFRGGGNWGDFPGRKILKGGKN